MKMEGVSGKVVQVGVGVMRDNDNCIETGCNLNRAKLQYMETLWVQSTLNFGRNIFA